jgi:hypothetical protein
MKRIIALAFLLLSTSDLSAQTYWKLQAAGNGWQWVSPTGAIVPRFLGVSYVDPTPLSSGVYSSKYSSSASTWAAAARDRLSSWGFNVADYYSYLYQQQWQSGWNVAYSPAFGTDGYAENAGSSYGTGNLAARILDSNAALSGMVCSSSFTGVNGGSGEQIDPYDTQLASIYATVIGKFNHDFGSLIPNAMAIMTNEGDTPFGENAAARHSDYGYVMGAINPSQTPPTGQSDHTVYAKINLRDWLLNDYLCTGAGTPVSTCTAAHQGTGSANPSSGSYVGASYASSALSSLNTAWGTSYTTWNTSDSGGLSGISSGSYASYGTGTGFLDENGTHLLPSSPTCSTIVPLQSWAAKSQIETDLHGFMGAFSAQHATLMLAAWNTEYPTHPPLLYPLYNPPSYIAAAVGTVLQSASYLGGNASNVLWIAPDQLSLSQTTAIIAATTGTPIIWADYTSAEPDSALVLGCSGANVKCYTTQPLRGAGMVSAWQSVLPLTDSNGKSVIVGLEHWDYYDQAGQADSGLVSDDDNPYDQSATLNSSSGSWTANHSYSAPVIISDGTNYEALSNSLASCTSGSTTPSWATKNGSITTDNTCVWRNEGPYALTHETSPLPNAATATYPNVGYGDVVSPVANYLSTLDPQPAPPTGLTAVAH